MARSSVLAALPLAVLAAAFPLSAQWVPVPALPGPQNRALFTLTPWSGGELLLFGGDVGNPAATEWSWNGLRWQPVTTPVPRRAGHAMARHGSTGELVLFGGQASASSPFFDTWTYSNGTWTQLAVAGGPTLAANLSMAWDPGSGAMVLIGGTGASGFETWRFDGGAWTQLNAFTSPLAYPEVFTDTVRGEVCMFLTGAQGAEVRRLGPAGWGLVATRPGFTPFGRVTFDSDRGRAVSVGLLSGTRYVHEYDGLQIVRVETGTTGVPVPPQFGLAFHPARHETVMVDYLTVGLSRYVADAVPMATSYGVPCVAPGFQLALAPGDSPQPGGSHRLQVSGSGAGNALSLALLGFSHVQFGGLALPQPIPLGTLGCLLRVEPTFVNGLGLGLPAQQIVSIPNTAALLGQRYDAQFASFDLGGSGVLDTSNGLEVQIGRPLPEYVLRESFLSDASRDPLASGDLWSNGAVTPVAVGGDGRHGSFDASAGLSLGNGVYSWNTDNQLIPASSTLTGAPALVTDGRFYFTDFVVPLGTTVRFVGAAPVQVFVRGQVDVRGVISVDAADLPFYVPTVGTSAGQRVSTFNARGTPATMQVQGQAGGNGGAGGGRGGDGGRECQGSGPIVIGGNNVTDGQPGQDVRVAAGHAYAAAAVGTGGSGSPLHPATGLTLSAGAPFIIATLSYRDEFSRGGGGGGYLLPGGAAATPFIPAPAFTQPNNSPAVAGGSAFPLLPFPSNPPSGYSSLEHYLVGGSGGGGGGSHTFGIAAALADVWMAGHAGSGGGGAVALRAGGQLSVVGSVTARGGAGVLINGDNPSTSTADVDRGASSPGGGGSGGSVLLQSARSVSVAGGLDTSGGAGSRTANVAVQALAPTQLNVQAQAGAGSHGFYRMEAGNNVSFTGSGVPAFNPATSSGPLADQDARTGSRSVWLLPASPTLPVYLRYELVVDIGGVTVLFSDDAAVSAVAANDPSGPVLLRFQGAQADRVTGAIVAGTVGPWRTQVAPGAGSLNADRAQALRFDLVVDKTQGQITVRELRVVWR